MRATTVSRRALWTFGPLIAALGFGVGCVGVDRVPAMDLWIYDRDGHPYQNLQVQIEASRHERSGSETPYQLVVEAATDANGRVRVAAQSELGWLGLGIFMHAAYPYYFSNRLVLRQGSDLALTSDLPVATTLHIMLERKERRALLLTFYHHDKPLPAPVQEHALSTPFLARPETPSYGADVAAAVRHTLEPKHCGDAEYSAGIKLEYEMPKYVDIDTHAFDAASGKPVAGYDAQGCDR